MALRWYCLHKQVQMILLASHAQ